MLKVLTYCWTLNRLLCSKSFSLRAFLNALLSVRSLNDWNTSDSHNIGLIVLHHPNNPSPSPFSFSSLFFSPIDLFVFFLVFFFPPLFFFFPPFLLLPFSLTFLLPPTITEEPDVIIVSKRDRCYSMGGLDGGKKHVVWMKSVGALGRSSVESSKLLFTPLRMSSVYNGK